MNEEERLRTIISLWMNRPAVMRARSYVIGFCAELRKSNPELLGDGTDSEACERVLKDLKKYLAN